MIRVRGATQRSFLFPAQLPTAFAYYADLGRTLTYLPHIFLVQAYQYDSFRMLYSTTELGIYHIRIFCDLTARMDEKDQTLYINELHDVDSVPPSVGPKSATTHGSFSSRSVFRSVGEKTTIEYSIRLRADLPTPLGLRFMPDAVVNRIAHNITRRRIREIADGFVERSIDAFPFWRAEMVQQGYRAL